MRVLVIGSGAREDALCWKLAQSPLVDKLYCTPGNPGTARVAENVQLPGFSPVALADWAQNERIDLTVVGPEEALAGGLTDVFAGRGLTVFGPSRAAAQIESSKSFAKSLMQRAGIPTADYRAFSNPEDALAFVRRADFPLVVKADGLAAGKGVVVCHSVRDAEDAVSTLMGRDETRGGLLVESFLEGREVSVFAICDGNGALMMVPARDHKRAGDGDTGPNTGGMGAIAPVADAPPDLPAQVRSLVVDPALAALRAMGHPYRGLLYCGLMLTAAGPKVVEFNARFGDPETQALLPMLRSDLAPVLWLAAGGDLSGQTLEWETLSSACVVMASKGYPGPYDSGLPIDGIERAEALGCRVFHAGTRLDGPSLRSSGGRVLSVVGTGDNLDSALDRAYAGVREIRMEGAFCRSDIGK